MKVNPPAATLSSSQSVLRNQVAQAGEVTRKMASPVAIDPLSLQEVQTSVVYTPSDDTPDVTYTHLKRSVQSGHFIRQGTEESINENTRAMQSAFSGMKSAWSAFHQTLATAAPDLAKKEFSFSIDKDGDMMATTPHGALTKSQMTQLTELMNKSGELKNATKKFAERTIDFANTAGSGLEGIDLNMSNFHQSLDIGTVLEHSQPNRITWGNDLVIDWKLNLTSQIYTKGVQRTWTEIA